MIERIFDSPTIGTLNKSMNVSQLRHEVTANNIANVNTPGFKRSEVVFEDKIKEVLQKPTIYGKLSTTNSKHIQIAESRGIDNAEPEIIRIDDQSYRNDGNNVDIDVENARMSKNKVFYDILGQSLNNEMRLLRIAITGRR